MQVGESEFLEVGQPVAQAIQCPGKQVNVTHAADHLLRLKPRGSGFAPRIQLLEPGGPCEPAARCRAQDLLKVVEKVILSAIKADQQPE